MTKSNFTFIIEEIFFQILSSIRIKSISFQNFWTTLLNLWKYISLKFTCVGEKSRRPKVLSISLPGSKLSRWQIVQWRIGWRRIAGCQLSCTRINSLYLFGLDQKWLDYLPYILIRNDSRKSNFFVHSVKAWFVFTLSIFLLPQPFFFFRPRISQ